MKKRITKVLLAGMIAAALGISALAADVSGLHAFLDSRSYTEGVFADVPAGKWYEAGVKTVYEKGIMDGVADDAFAPGDTVTWAQAVTIAARLHAAYNGAEIPDAGGAWYSKYMTYAKTHGILPATAPKGGSVVVEVISRQELAGLFCGVFAEKDLPVVNDTDIPDLLSVRPELRDAVCVLYSAGIFTGKDNRRFDPEGQTTRAEIAVVVSRLLDPALRVSCDSAADGNMADQWGNYGNGGYAVRLGDEVYYTARQRVADGWKYCIVARSDSGETRSIYETDAQLTRLLASEDGSIFFVENKNRLMVIDPKEGTEVMLYSSPGTVEHFVLYDDGLYVLDGYEQNGQISGWKYRIGRVEKSSLVILVNNLSYREVRYLNVMHAYEGKLYFIYSDTGEEYGIWAIDLQSGKLNREHTANVHLGEAAFSGATYWYLRVNDAGRYEIVRGNFRMMEYEAVQAVLPKEAQKKYGHLFVNGGRVFFQSSEAACLWEIGASGEVYEPVALPGVSCEYATVTKQGVLLHSLATLSSLVPQQILVKLPDGSEQTYPEFLDMPYFVWGAELFETFGGEVRWETTAAEESNISAEADRAYFTTDGDLVVEIAVGNHLERAARVIYITVVLTGWENEIETVYYVSQTMDAGEVGSFSAVIPAAWQEGVTDLSGVTVDILVTYN